MLMTEPESDSKWMEWFSHLANVPFLVLITSDELWLEMLAEQTVRIWMSKAPAQLERVEFWGSVIHATVPYEEIADVWTNSTGCPMRVKYAAVKSKAGVWDVVQGGFMRSGPHAKIICR
jgi:hypothetical protein